MTGRTSIDMWKGRERENCPGSKPRIRGDENVKGSENVLMRAILYSLKE